MLMAVEVGTKPPLGKDRDAAVGAFAFCSVNSFNVELSTCGAASERNGLFSESTSGTDTGSGIFRCGESVELEGFLGVGGSSESAWRRPSLPKKAFVRPAGRSAAGGAGLV